ncbi:hypothetical protein ES703_78824 [subsurface metagenome]
MRTTATPQSKLLGDDGILPNSVLYLAGTIHQPFLGEKVDKQLPVVFPITAGSQPANSIILVHRGEGQHEQELLLLLIRQAHDDIVGLHRLFTPEIDLFGYSPQVFLVVEYPGIAHMVAPVY